MDCLSLSSHSHNARSSPCVRGFSTPVCMKQGVPKLLACVSPNVSPQNESAAHYFNIRFPSLSFYLSSPCRGRKFGRAVPPREAQRHQLPGAPRPGQDGERGALHLHGRTALPAEEGAARLPVPPGRACPAVPRHSVHHGPPQRLPGRTLP